MAHIEAIDFMDGDTDYFITLRFTGTVPISTIQHIMKQEGFSQGSIWTTNEYHVQDPISIQVECKNYELKSKVIARLQSHGLDSF